MIYFSELFEKDLGSIRSALVDAPNQYGETALNYLASNCNAYPTNATMIASYLLGMGANVSATDAYNMTPINLALSKQCDLSMVKLLHQSGGNLTEAAQDTLIHSRLSSPVAKYVIENADVDCGGSVAATFCDKKLFDKSVFVTYTNKCIQPLIMKSGGIWSVAEKVMENVHPMVPFTECHYHRVPESSVTFLTGTASTFPGDFVKNYPGCAEVIGEIQVVSEGQGC